jgi:hypothetical protein
MDVSGLLMRGLPSVWTKPASSDWGPFLAISCWFRGSLEAMCNDKVARSLTSVWTWERRVSLDTPANLH